VISEDVIAEILRRTDIVELIGSYLPLRAAGRTFKALCPFHTEKTPSFVVNPERQIFHCFGCGEGGDAIGFLLKHERLAFPEAVRLLADRANVVLPARSGGRGGEGDGRLALLDAHRHALAHFQENLRGPEGARACAYLAGRGMTPALIEQFGLGYALPGWDGLLRALTRRGYAEAVLRTAGLVVERQSGRGSYDRFRHRLMIPIWDASGKVIAFGGRALDDAEVKYLNSPETPLYRKGGHLYGLNLAGRAIHERGHAIVVEGYFDAISLHAHGFGQSVAALGTALTGEQARLLRRHTTRALLVFDPDAPGIGAARRTVEQLVNADLDWRIVLLPDRIDPDAFVRRHGPQAFQAALDQAQDVVDFFLDARVSGLDLADPLQRARAVEALVEVVGGVEEPIRREAYAQRIAQRTGVSDRALQEALGRQRAKGGTGGRTDAPAARPAAQGVAASPEEELLVAIALAVPEWRARVAASLAPEAIGDPLLRRIFVGFVQGGEARPLSLQAPEVQQRVAALIARGGRQAAAPTDGADPDSATLGRMVEDCLGKIRGRQGLRERETFRRVLAATDEAQALQLLSQHPKARVKDPHPTS
jgi:DNA primase